MRHIMMGAVLALGVAQAAAAQPGRDWSAVASRKPDGAFIQGNPAAPVKIVEYLSLTCPHCAAFEAEGIAPLTAKYIRTGQASYEVRHALRDAFDYAGSLLARCDGPQAFFRTMPAVYARQEQWLARAAKWSQTAPDSAGMTPDKMLPMVADGAGLTDFFVTQGLAPAKARACVANTAEQQVLAAMAGEAWKRPDFPGTPTFLINGTMAEGVGTWAELDRRIAAVLASRSGAKPVQKRR